MKRKMHNAFVLMIVLILCVLAVGGVCLYMASKKENHEETPKVEEGPTGEVKFLNSKRDESVITQRYKAYLNGKNIDIEIKYDYKVENYTEPGAYSRLEEVTGTFGDLVLFRSLKETNATTQRPDMFETGKIDKAYNSNYFKVIRGTDGKDYLAIATKFDDFEVPVGNYLYVFNDNMELISNVFDDELTCKGGNQTFVIQPAENGLLVDENIWYPNQFNYTNFNKVYTLVKVESNKIYYLYEDIDYVDEKHFGNVEERVCTINDSKIDCKTEKIHKASGLFGQSC